MGGGTCILKPSCRKSHRDEILVVVAPWKGDTESLKSSSDSTVDGGGKGAGGGGGVKGGGGGGVGNEGGDEGGGEGGDEGGSDANGDGDGGAGGEAHSSVDTGRPTPPRRTLLRIQSLVQVGLNSILRTTASPQDHH